FVQQHRMHAGIIVDAPLYYVRFKNEELLGTVEDKFAETFSPGDNLFFSGLVLEVERIDGIDLIFKASSKSARIPTYMGARIAISTNLADRVRTFLYDREQ